MQTFLKIINVAVWNFQLLPLPILHTLYMGEKCPLSILKYPKMPKSFLKLFEILEIKMQETRLTKPINNIYQFCLALLNNKEIYNAKVLVLMSSGKLQRTKKKKNYLDQI